MAITKKNNSIYLKNSLLRILTFFLSTLTGLFGFTFLVSVNVSDAALYVASFGFYSLASTTLLSIASIRKDKFVSRLILREAAQISISKILTILNIALALIVFFLGVYKEFMILYLIQSISIYPLISSFQKGTYYQFKKINKFWRFQFYASVTRASLVGLLIFFESFNALTFSLVHLIITFQIYLSYHSSWKQLLIRSRSLTIWLIYFKPMRLFEGFLRNCRVFVETGLSSILLSCTVLLGFSDKLNLESQYAVIPYMNVAIIALRQIFYNFEVQRKYISFPPWQVMMLALLGFIILNNAYVYTYAWDTISLILPGLAKNTDNLFYFWSAQLIFFTLSIGTTQVEVFRSSELFVFWSIFLISLLASFAAVIMLNNFALFLLVVPFSLSVSSIVSKLIKLVRKAEG